MSIDSVHMCDIVILKIVIHVLYNFKLDSLHFMASDNGTFVPLVFSCLRMCIDFPYYKSLIMHLQTPIRGLIQP